METLRRRMGTAQAKIAQAPDATKGGNATKRIRLRLQVPGYQPGDARRLTAMLAAPAPTMAPIFVLAWHPQHYQWKGTATGRPSKSPRQAGHGRRTGRSEFAEEESGQETGRSSTASTGTAAWSLAALSHPA